MQINEITTTTIIIIVISVLIMTSGMGILSSLVFAQTDSEDSETDLADLTLTNSSGVQVEPSGAELPQQQPQYNISHTEQCSARVQSFIQKAQDAMNTGEYGQWRSMSDPEVQQLNKECPEQMQEQQ